MVLIKLNEIGLLKRNVHFVTLKSFEIREREKRIVVKMMKPLVVLFVLFFLNPQTS